MSSFLDRFCEQALIHRSASATEVVAATAQVEPAAPYTVDAEPSAAVSPAASTVVDLPTDLELPSSTASLTRAPFPSSPPTQSAADTDSHSPIALDVDERADASPSDAAEPGSEEAGLDLEGASDPEVAEERPALGDEDDFIVV